MLVDVTKELKTYTGQTMMDSDGQGNAVPATIKLVLISVLNIPVQTDKLMQKLAKDELTRKIFKAEKEVELTAEDVVMIKGCMENATMLTPVVVGQTLRILEGKE